MPRFASPTLQTLSVTVPNRAPSVTVGSPLEEAILHLSFRLSSLGRLDQHFPALASLTLTPCLPPIMDSSVWALTSSLRSLNLSSNGLTTHDIDLIWPHLPSGLHKLSLDANRLDALPPSFPPALRELSVAYNESLDDATRWIDALPLTLRWICAKGCRLDDDAGMRLLELHRRAGVRQLTGKAKLKVHAGGNQFSNDVRDALEAVRDD
ncbi:hypothetical protein GGF31_007308 [Allomyces arbusculus]|nr:hypothetical protein GGF31_007308 [Allomyces arbusculus]